MISDEIRQLWARVVAEAKLALDGDALLKEGNGKSELLSSFLEALNADGSQSTVETINDLKARARECGANLKILQKDLGKLGVEGAQDASKKLNEMLEQLVSFTDGHEDMADEGKQFAVVMAALWAHEEGQLQVQYDMVTMGLNVGSDLWFGRLSLLCPHGCS